MKSAPNSFRITSSSAADESSQGPMALDPKGLRRTIAEISQLGAKETGGPFRAGQPSAAWIAP
jgi:hypothetical protein